jgi:hypothetical protein
MPSYRVDRVCVAFVKANREERENSKYRTAGASTKRSSSFSATRRHSGEYGSSDLDGWESVDDRPYLDGRRPVLAKSHTSADLGYGPTRLRGPKPQPAYNNSSSALMEETTGYNPFPEVEVWDLDEPESKGQMGIPAGKRGFSKHSEL